MKNNVLDRLTTKILLSAIIILFCILLLSLLCTSSTLDTAFALARDGSESAPYQITNAEELRDLIKTGAGNSYDGEMPPFIHYEITNDITLNLDSFETVTNAVKYCVIEGNYHTITINKLFVWNYNAALFPNCENSIFRNIYLRTQNENNTISIVSEEIYQVGAIAGSFAYSLENCVNFVNFDIITGINGVEVGGLYIGASRRVDNCVNYGNIRVDATNTLSSMYSQICAVSGLGARTDSEWIINSGNYGDLSIIGADRVYIGGLCARGMNPNVINSFSVNDISIIDCNCYYSGSLIADSNDSDFNATIANSYAVSNMTVNGGVDVNYSPKSFYGGYSQTSSNVYSALMYNWEDHSQTLGPDDSAPIESIDFATVENYIKNELCAAFNAIDGEGYVDWSTYEGYPQHKSHYSLTINKNKNCGTVSETAINGILFGEQIKTSGGTMFVAGKTITTSPNDGCEFSHWDGDIGMVNKNCTATAYFIELVPTIESSTPETNSGEVESAITVDEGVWEDWRLVTKQIDANPALSVPSGKTAVNTYNAALFRGNTVVTPTGKLTLKVKAPAELSNQQGVQVIMINEDNSLAVIDATVENGYVVFTTEKLGDFLIVEPAAPSLLWLWILLAVLAALVAIILLFIMIPRKVVIHIPENNESIMLRRHWLQKIRVDEEIQHFNFYKDADRSEEITLNRMPLKNVTCWAENPYLQGIYWTVK